MFKRINKGCIYFPCHQGLEDCTFCYCPFYPCEDESLGEYIESIKLDKNIWSCKNCNWIHKVKIVDCLHRLIRLHRDDLREAIFATSRQRQRFQYRNIGVVILGHGSKLKKANEIISTATKNLKKTLGLCKVYPAYLKIAEPNLPTSIENLVKKRCKKIIIIPFFLFAGNHVNRDIPEIITEEKARYPHINFVYTKNLGEDVRILDIVADRIKEGLNGDNK